MLQRLSTIAYPPRKPPHTTGSALTIAGIKEAPQQQELILSQLSPAQLSSAQPSPAQPSSTTAMRALVLALLGICCLTTYVVEGVGSEVLEQRICVSLTSRRLPVKNIKTYTIREGPVRAIIFITKRGLKVCADPKVEWVKKAVETMDDKKNANQSKPTGTQQLTSTVVTRVR
ncbi:lymphotactin-like [Sturnira hondurensis]|uniref:lymphotactin-like n=1 Tax=Sturnira hondurensis TaxID=192404 RepID=UPI00187A14F9|nr:lymphotactin-like [Sturnira hondurensis]